MREREFLPKDYPREYASYNHMKTRCLNPNNKDYYNYGQRGITISPNFLLPFGEGFDNFMRCVGNKPLDKKSLDRINTNGNYEEGNLRWADDFEQANNKNNNRLLTYEGRTQNLQSWCDELGLISSRVSARLNKLGLSDEDALKLELANGKGSDATMSKLTKEQVVEVFLSTDEYTTISKKYGIAIAAISRIKNRRRYKEETKHLGDPGRSSNPSNPSRNKKSLTESISSL